MVPTAPILTMKWIAARDNAKKTATAYVRAAAAASAGTEEGDSKKDLLQKKEER